MVHISLTLPSYFPLLLYLIASWAENGVGSLAIFWVTYPSQNAGQVIIYHPSVLIHGMYVGMGGCVWWEGKRETERQREQAKDKEREGNVAKICT